MAKIKVLHRYTGPKTPTRNPGEFVTPDYAKNHPNTTQREITKIVPKKK